MIIFLTACKHSASPSPASKTINTVTREASLDVTRVSVWVPLSHLTAGEKFQEVGMNVTVYAFPAWEEWWASAHIHLDQQWRLASSGSSFLEAEHRWSSEAEEKGKKFSCYKTVKPPRNKKGTRFSSLSPASWVLRLKLYVANSKPRCIT